MTKLFVYGTLKRDGGNHHYLASQRFLGAARTSPGYRLFEVGGFPGMVPFLSDERGVTGEVWEVDDAGLAILDEFEGVHEGLYRRERVPLLPPFERESVDAYLYAKAVEGRPVIGETWPESRSPRP
jgi:gamma-glutamylaminecyclotransferase